MPPGSAPAFEACGGGSDEPVGFDDLDATKEGFAAGTEAAYVDAGEDPADSSTRNNGVSLEECLILDEAGFAAILEVAGSTSSTARQR